MLPDAADGPRGVGTGGSRVNESRVLEGKSDLDENTGAARAGRTSL